MKKLSIFILVLSFACTEQYDVPNHYPGVIRIFDNKSFVAYGEGGLIISDLSSGSVLAHIFPPRKMNSIDDFDVDGDLLFILDSRNKDHLAVFSISDLNNPELVEGPIAVQGGPYNGVSAKGGNVVVSGGTFFLEYFQYSSSGKLTGSTTFGRDRGHPDVLLSDNGQVAFISNDFIIQPDEPRFGVIALYLGDDLSIPGVLDEHKIEQAGFTQGVSSPVGFPIQLKLHNGHLLVAHGAGLTTIELIDDSAFGTTQFIDLGIDANAIETLNDTAYLTGYTSEPVLLKLDISDIVNPVIIETIPLNIDDNIPTSIAVSNSSVFITAGKAGILEFNL